MRLSIVLATLAYLVNCSPLRAQDAGIEFFEKKIRPVLVEHCYECHALTAKKVRGGLLLDSRDALRKGGDSGPALVPGDPDKSPMIQAVRYTGSTKMPKKGKLPAAVIADLETWVKMGAPDPRDKAPASIKAAKSWDEIVRERRTWWSLQPVKKPTIPTPKNAAWSAQPIDRFLLSALEAKGLAPAPDADARTLVRRLSLVLTGLPPTPAEVDDFAKAWNVDHDAALAGLVDRLLASPHFGERWARHWMDVVRFTETHGNEWNYDVHHAWRYRDYLIRAFNDDVPYAQLVREHIAGDLLAKPRIRLPSPSGRGAGGEGGPFNESILGTAFYRFGEVNHDDCIDLRSIGYDIADNQIDTLSKAFQGMTIACARCHDHKLDAISLRDYHGLLGILRSSRQVAHTIDAPEVNAETMRKMRDVKRAIRRELADAWLKPIDAEKLDKALQQKVNEKTPGASPFAWLRLVGDVGEKQKLAFAEAWAMIAARMEREDDAARKSNEKNITMYADFRRGVWPQWQIDGQGLRDKPSRSGDFAIAAGGDRVFASLLPAGAYTHTLSEKLNGALRSPVLSAGKRHVSVQVIGAQAAAVRLVSSSCQLNYRNFRYLKANEPTWITFPIPEDADSLRTYVELMTKLDNPKFPDQLGALGGGPDQRVPFEKAAADPRSHFGVMHVVLHDQPAPPSATLSHLRALFAGVAPQNPAEVGLRVSQALGSALRAWRNDRASDDDVLWINACLQSGILSAGTDATPKLATLVAEYRKLEAQLATPRVAPGLADFGPGIEQPIFARGDCMKPGEMTPRRFVTVLAPTPITGKGSGRLELANALASPDNPLTARVMVNRVWHHLFGSGLVRTVDDFGHVGELPSHPELLDHLADRFVADGWSMKKLIRNIVLTRAFRLSHTPSPAMIEVDPENRLLARYPARRMEAEAIRDSLLATSGRLDRTLFGPSVSAYREKEYADRRLFKGPLDGNGRRSVYIRVTLMEPPKFLEIFNFPGSKVCQGRRDVTSTPAQALAMLNDPFVHDQAEVWAKHLVARKDDNIDRRLRAMFQTALGRTPRETERQRFGRFIHLAAAQHGVRRDAVLQSVIVWREVGHVLFNLQEFITIP